MSIKQMSVLDWFVRRVDNVENYCGKSIVGILRSLRYQMQLVHDKLCSRDS